jgi:hypothetical protein
MVERAHEIASPLDGWNRRGVQYYLTIGNVDGSIEWFEEAVEQRQPMAVVYVGDPLTKRLRSSPRWAALVRTMNLEP